MESNRTNRYLVPNLQKACQLLKFLSKHEDALTITQISKDMNIPYTSCLRILSTLKEEGMVILENNKYLLGAAIIPIGLNALNRIDLRKVSVPILEELSSETGETSHIAIFSNEKSLLIEVFQSPQPIRVGAPSGTLVDLYCSSTGKVFLSYLVDDLKGYCERNTLEQKTTNTYCRYNDLKKEIDIIREQGYSVDDEEFVEGVRCLAAPIFGPDNKVVAAIGITGTTQRFSRNKINKFSKIVIKASQEISKQIGC